MNRSNIVYYKSAQEIIGEPSLKVTDKNNEDKKNRTVDILYNITGICKEKLLFFIDNFGIDKILENPSIMGVTSEQEEKLTDLKQLLLSLGEI